jgi:hypothetical protein
MNGQELLDTKTHQIWLKGFDGSYKPWRDYIYLDADYSQALKAASYFTQQGWDVKLVTSIITYVI